MTGSHLQRIVLAAIGAAMAMTACTDSKQTKQPTMAKIACDESFENILEQEINVYEYI